MSAQQPAPFWRTAALLVAASVLYCAPLFSNPDNWGRQDWDQFTFRYETPLHVALLRDHVFPAWNPYANGGTALLAHPDSPVLSPWYLIVLVLGGPLGLRVQVVVFMALGAIGMAAFLARLGATRAGSIAGGIVFMMSSHFALHVAEGHLEWCVLGLMPWLALCVLRLQEGLRYIILAALLLASVLAFGTVYIPAVYLPFFSIWILFGAIRVRQWQPLLRWGAVVVLAALLSSVKLLPTMAFTSDWPREVRLVQQTPPGVVLAALFDPRQALMYKVYRDRNLPDGHFAKTIASADAAPLLRSLEALRVNEGFHEYGCYIGLAGILLAVWGAIRTSRRLWPLYAAGACAGVVVLGASSTVDLWGAMRHVPLYSQLQVPSRFMAAVVFMLSVAVAFGLTAATGAMPESLRRWRHAIEVVIIAVLYTELALLGRSLFRDVFVLPPPSLEAHSDFAHRFRQQTLYPVITQSTMYGYLLSNSGTLKAYENVSVARTAVLAPDDPAYRGEVYLEGGRGAARISKWTMSRVTVLVEPDQPDNLILNQNFYHGWSARLRDVRGQVEVIEASPSEGGLISVPVDREHREVELFYVPDGLVVGSWISGATLVLCLAGLWFTRAPRTSP